LKRIEQSINEIKGKTGGGGDGSTQRDLSRVLSTLNTIQNTLRGSQTTAGGRGRVEYDGGYGSGEGITFLGVVIYLVVFLLICAAGYVGWILLRINKKSESHF